MFSHYGSILVAGTVGWIMLLVGAGCSTAERWWISCTACERVSKRHPSKNLLWRALRFTRIQLNKESEWSESTQGGCSWFLKPSNHYLIVIIIEYNIDFCKGVFDNQMEIKSPCTVFHVILTWTAYMQRLSSSIHGLNLFPSDAQTALWFSVTVNM